MRIAFVAPFYGREASGGAESECRQTALRLAAAGVGVDVLTTCALDLQHGWEVQYHPEGATADHDLTVRRFATEAFDPLAFASLNQRVTSGENLPDAVERQFMALHVNSGGLCRYLAERRATYDWVVFIPYLYGTSVFGSRLCPGRAVLIPCLHDEPYARLRLVGDLFARAARIVFHTRAEQDLARRLYGDAADKGVVLGEGVETDFPADAERFRSRYGLRGPFLLYAGRKDAAKNVPTLLEYFARYCRRRPSDLQLVLLGPGALPIPAAARAAVKDLGFVPEQDKRDAYAAATVLCQPSLHESFSLVMMESWACGVPCLVHGGCAVTRAHVVEAGGGLWFTTYGEFEGCLDRLLADPELRRGMGAAGRRYARGRFGWDRIIRRFQDEVFGPQART